MGTLQRIKFPPFNFQKVEQENRICRRKKMLNIEEKSFKAIQTYLLISAKHI